MIRRLATVLLLAIAASMLFAAENAKKPKNEFTTLADFTGSANGAVPLYGDLIEGTDGNFYGTTYGGGVYDEGTVFEATPDGTLTILYSFCSQTSCTDGTGPSSTLVQFEGNFYGTAEFGGANSEGIIYEGGTVFEVTPGGQLTTLYSFCSQTGCTDGAYPFAGLVQFGGNFYGTTLEGGTNGLGTVFKITPSGTLTTLYSFCSQGDCTDGYLPYAGLIQGTDGNFYGTTYGGGAVGGGTVFKITPSGTLTTLYSFCSQGDCTDGLEPFAGLIQGTDGNFYGTTQGGGANGWGTVFKITPGGTLTTLYSFCSQSGCADGEYPYAGLIQASDGNFYGTTNGGGANGSGTVFGITPGGQLSTLYSFCSQSYCSDGGAPTGGLLQANGNLYGVTGYGGDRFDGTVFSLPVGLELLAKTQPSFGKAGANITVHRPDLTGATSRRFGGTAAANFIKRPDLAGAAGLGLSGDVAVFPGLPLPKLRTREFAGAATGPMKATAPAGRAKPLTQNLTTLLSFDGANGAYPFRTFLIQGTDGNVYGTTSGGSVYDQGTVFKVTTGGTLTTLYTFCSNIDCTDGAEPEAGLVQATNGDFYGTTTYGGANAGGTVFEITSAGQLTTLYNFCSQPGCTDGFEPIAGLVQGTDGNFYGTTVSGGVTDFCGGCGTVFKITPSGTLTTLYSFCSQSGCTDGIEPEAGLVQGTDGNFYGTTSFYGANGEGTVFKITPSGTLTTLYSFCSQSGCTDGAEPEAVLVQGTDGNFYGTTEAGGSNGAGTVFEVTPGGQLTTLYSFCSQTGCTDGAQPIAGLVQAGGNFYGTAELGGANDGGTVFEVTPGGQFTTLYSFCSQPYCTDGASPAGGLVQANGNLYGTTVNAGTRGVGTIFTLPVVQQSLTLSCPTFTAQVGVAYNSALTATGGLAPYTFSIPSGSLPPGLTLNASTGAITGTPTTAGLYNFIAQVVDSQSNTVTTNCGIVVSPIPLTLSCPTGTGVVGVLYSSSLTAVGGVAPYTFSISSGSLPPGLTLNTSTGAITGTPTTGGTYNFTSKVVDSQGNKATASCSITINATQSCTNNGNLNGNYAFLYQGWSNFSGSGDVLTATAGSLVFDGNGNITSGQYDQNDPVDGPSQGTLTGTYCVPANNVGTATINGSNGNTTTYAFVLQPNGNGNVIPYDTTTPWDASGIFLKQNTSDFSTSDFTGQYSLGFIGVDEDNNRFGLAGAFTANGTANLTNGELDGDDGGNYHNGTFSSDNFNVTPSGRGTASLSVSGVGTGNFAFYVVNSSQLLAIQIDPISQGLQSLFSGQIVQQQGLTYSDSDLNGVSVLGMQGLDTSCSPACADAQLDFVQWNGSGSFSHSGDRNDGGTVSSETGSGTYSVGSNGRVALADGGGSGPVFYLTGKNAGFAVDNDNQRVEFGSMVSQSGSNFNNNSISGNYYGGSWELVSSSICGEVALLNVNSGNGNHTGESNCGESPRSETNSLTYTVSSDGRTVVTSNGLPNDIIYIVSPSSGGSGGSFISLPWEGNTNAKLVSFGVVPTTLTLSCPTGTGQVGVAYSSALVASGGVAPYTFSIISGSLPPGLTLNSSTGAITGAPTTAGTYNFTAQVVDSQGNTASASCSIVVSPSTLTLSCPTGTAQVGFAYSSALVASGGVAPYTFSIISGSLPPGLTLNASTGAITGTPTTAGTYNFTAQVVDSQGNTATSSCSIVVSPSTLTLSCPTGTAQVGFAYSSALVASGGVAPYTFSIVSGSLPPGLTLNASTGAITGTPTTAGTYNFTAQVVDSKGNTASASCSIVVSPAALTLSCPTGTGQVGVGYSSALTASGGVAPYTFSIVSGSLPPGLTLNTSTGAITGTPTTAGTYNFTAQVVDSKGNTATASCSIVVSMPTLTLSCPTGTAQLGVAYSSALVASGGVAPYTFSIVTGSLPPGLTLNTSTGAITGTPNTAGTYNFTAQVVDSKGNTASASCSIVVSMPTLSLTCPIGTAQVGVAYSSALVATGGNAPYTFSIISGSLPPGLSLNSSTGAITGTPTTAGMFNFTARVMDSQGNTATTGCGIVVSTLAITVTCPTNTAQVGVAYSSAIAATGGVAPYTFSLISGFLPPGLTLNPSTGAVTGTPTTGGTFSFTVQVVDSQGNTATASCSIVVSSVTLVLSCPAGTAQVGVAYSSALVATGGVAPYTFSLISGSLPPGLTLNPSTGAITGTPTTGGTYNFTAKVADSQGNTATASCSITVFIPTALTLSCPAGTAQVGIAYSSALSATGGVPGYKFAIINGLLPSGLTLNTSTGAITGTPTTTGTYNFTAQVVDSQGNTTTASCSIVVASATASPSTTSLALAPSSVPLGSSGPVVMTATVTPTSGGGTPTGTVTFFNGPTQVGTATLSGGVGTFNYNPSGLAVGIYSITAVYSGDSTFAPSTSSPQTLAISQTGPFAYVANNSSNTVSVINIPTGQVVNNIAVGSGPVGTAISPDQTQVYVTNNQGNSVSVISAASGTVVAIIPVQSSPFGVVFTPDGTQAYIVNGSSNTVSVINTATQTVVATVPVQNSPVGVAMAPTSNGTFAYVANSGSNTVSVIAVTSNPAVVQTIPVGTGPRWVTVSPNSKLAYVENGGSNNVSVISVATNTVTATIPVGTSPFGADFTPDNSTVYVANSGSNTVSVIDTQSGTVIYTVAGLNNPVRVAFTMDGSSAYVTNLNANTVSVIDTQSIPPKVVATVAGFNAPTGVAIASAPQMTLQITQPLSSTQPNPFNFGSNTYTVQYPAGTQFSNVSMTVTAVEITQAQFQQRVKGTKFANASCIVYGGGAGNCIDEQVACYLNGSPVSCPSEGTPSIAVQTNFTTEQGITNPGYLTTPIGQNEWKDIFTGFSDITVKGKTQGFSEFIAVNLGATDPQGSANFELLKPKLPRNYEYGVLIPIEFKLTSVANGKPVNHAKAGLSVVMIADAKGNPTDVVIYEKTRAFEEIAPGLYKHDLAAGLGAGTYAITIYGESFPAYQGQFKILH